MIARFHRHVQTGGEHRGGLLRALVVAHEDRIDAGDHVDVLQKIRKHLGALPAAFAERRIFRDGSVRIRVADEDDRRRRPLLEEVCEAEHGNRVADDRDQPQAPPSASIDLVLKQRCCHGAPKLTRRRASSASGFFTTSYSPSMSRFCAAFGPSGGGGS